MSEFRLSANPREVVGKKVKNLRKEGLLPGVVYGKSDPVSVQLVDREVRDCFRAGGKDGFLTLELNGGERLVIVKDLQRHLTRGDLLHVDFQEVSATDTITNEVILNFVGESPINTNEGGIIQLMQSVDVDMQVSQMISEIEVDISQMTSVEQVIRLSDIDWPEGMELSSAEPETTIARYEEFRAALELEEEELLEGEEGGEEGEGTPAEGGEDAGE